MLPVVLYRLEGADKIIIASYQDRHVIVALKAVRYHIGSQLDIDPLLIGRAVGPVVVNETSQAQLTVGYRIYAGEECWSR